MDYIRVPTRFVGDDSRIPCTQVTLFLASSFCRFNTFSFTAGTLLCCTAATFPQLLFGRVIQGLGTGVAMPLMFNVVIDQVPFEHMGMMMGVASLIISLAPAIGPAYGVVVLEAFGWHAMFFVCGPPPCCGIRCRSCLSTTDNGTGYTPI